MRESQLNEPLRVSYLLGQDPMLGILLTRVLLSQSVEYEVRLRRTCIQVLYMWLHLWCISMRVRG